MLMCMAVVVLHIGLVFLPDAQAVGGSGIVFVVDLPLKINIWGENNG